MWRWFNAITENLKANLDLLPKRTLALQGLCDVTCGLIDPTVANQTALAMAG